MKTLIFILTYNAEKTIVNTLSDIPSQYINTKNVEILLIDDASADKTVDVAKAHVKTIGLNNIRILKNDINQGYGGNQKVGYTYAIKKRFDVVVMLHGDNQYTPRALPDLLAPIEKDPTIDYVLGVRFGSKYSPLSGGMPLYKYIGNRILTKFQNKMAGVKFSEWHTGYRAYTTKALSRIAFALNTNDFHFDTEILLQLIERKANYMEINIPTHYGKEICHVNGIRYAKDVMKASLRFMLQKYFLFYDVRYHPKVILGEKDGDVKSVYQEKVNFLSPHNLVIQSSTLVPSKSRVLDIGSSFGYVADALIQEKECVVAGVDMLAREAVSKNFYKYEKINLETEQEKLHDLIQQDAFDVILLLDIIEHLSEPEKFMLGLSQVKYKKKPRFICSTANIGFVVIRLMLLMGHFNYGIRGILDITHKRLFSAHTFRNLLEQTGFVIQEKYFIPFPFQSLGISKGFGSFLEKINKLFIKLRPRLFSYQIVFEAVPIEPPDAVLDRDLMSA